MRTALLSAMEQDDVSSALRCMNYKQFKRAASKTMLWRKMVQNNKLNMFRQIVEFGYAQHFESVKSACAIAIEEKLWPQIENLVHEFPVVVNKTKYDPLFYLRSQIGEEVYDSQVFQSLYSQRFGFLPREWNSWLKNCYPPYVQQHIDLNLCDLLPFSRDLRFLQFFYSENLLGLYLNKTWPGCECMNNFSRSSSSASLIVEFLKFAIERDCLMFFEQKTTKELIHSYLSAILEKKSFEIFKRYVVFLEEDDRQCVFYYFVGHSIDLFVHYCEFLMIQLNVVMKDKALIEFVVMRLLDNAINETLFTHIITTYSMTKKMADALTRRNRYIHPHRLKKIQMDHESHIIVMHSLIRNNDLGGFEFMFLDTYAFDELTGFFIDAIELNRLEFVEFLYNKDHNLVEKMCAPAKEYYPIQRDNEYLARMRNSESLFPFEMAIQLQHREICMFLVHVSPIRDSFICRLGGDQLDDVLEVLLVKGHKLNIYTYHHEPNQAFFLKLMKKLVKQHLQHLFLNVLIAPIVEFVCDFQDARKLFFH